jgi:hypothetical protein
LTYGKEGQANELLQQSRGRSRVEYGVH